MGPLRELAADPLKAPLTHVFDSIVIIPFLPCHCPQSRNNSSSSFVSPDTNTTMGRKRADSPSNIKFQQPDRSGPKEKTLLELAEERGLFAQAQKKQEENDKYSKTKIKKIPIKPENPNDHDNEPLSPGAERFLDTTLYTMSLTMLHFTLDVLVQNQYSADRIVWPKVWMRAFQALFGMSIRA